MCSQAQPLEGRRERKFPEGRGRQVEKKKVINREI